ncbi:MAG: hypothetical protein II028_03530, partial [Clostridia bacterium]|nr:hypothetical protein [Clostridia bacterium]
AGFLPFFFQFFRNHHLHDLLCMALIYPKTNPPVYQMVFTEPSIAVKKPLHHHFSRVFFIITAESGCQIPIFRQAAICFDHYTIADRRGQLPCFQREGGASLRNASLGLFFMRFSGGAGGFLRTARDRPMPAFGQIALKSKSFSLKNQNIFLTACRERYNI